MRGVKAASQKAKPSRFFHSLRTVLARTRHGKQVQVFKTMQTEPLSQQLNALLAHEGPLSLGLLLDRVGEKGFGLLLVTLSLPSALPVPAAGYSIPFGIALALLGGQMVIGRPHPWFPTKVRRTKLPEGMMSGALKSGAWVFAKLEHLVRPRLRWITGSTAQRSLGLLVIFMALLMMIPIPMTNTLPAMVVFLLGVALIEEDGLFGLAAFGAGIITAAAYLALVIAIILYGPEIAVEIKDWLKSLLGSGT